MVRNAKIFDLELHLQVGQLNVTDLHWTDSFSQYLLTEEIGRECQILTMGHSALDYGRGQFNKNIVNGNISKSIRKHLTSSYSYNDLKTYLHLELNNAR